MNKTTFINLAKDLALAAFIAALVYVFFCAISLDWINLLGHSCESRYVRAMMTLTVHITVIPLFMQRIFRS